jgi:hypothetical protein
MTPIALTDHQLHLVKQAAATLPVLGRDDFLRGVASGNRGGRPKVLGEVQELARQHAPKAIVELARLALRAKNETARIAAIRELLDRGYGRPRKAMEVSIPADNPLQLLLDEIDARSRIEPPVSHTPDRN